MQRDRVYLLYMLLVLASAVFLGSDFLGTRDRILLYQILDFPFRRLLRLAGSRWRYSTPPPHGLAPDILESHYIAVARTTQKIPLLLSEQLRNLATSHGENSSYCCVAAGKCTLSPCLAMITYCCHGKVYCAVA
jgi:hypothetical protein